MRKHIRAFALLALFLLTALGAAQAQVGKPFAWGGNTHGQLGTGDVLPDVSPHATPAQVLNLTGVVQVASGGYWNFPREHSLALKSDGTVWAWGANGYGQLGDGTNTDRNTPVQVLNLTGMVHIAAGGVHSLAVKSDGTVWAWGWNGVGALGDGTTTDKATPVQVSGITGVVQVAGGSSHSLALKSDGTVWAWGWNEYNQLGDGTITSRVVPVKVSGITGVVQVAGGQYHSLALKSDGTVWAWGHNPYGQLGDGTKTDRSTPVQVSGITGVAQVASGGFGHSLAVKLDGTVWAWGYNNTGQLGDGTQTDRLTPIQTVNWASSHNLTQPLQQGLSH